MKMPFGKHKDKEVHTVPQDYLLWFRDNITNLNGDLLKAVIAGLDGKPFERPSIKQRVDEAKKNMLERLRNRDMVCGLAPLLNHSSDQSNKHTTNFNS